MPARTLKESIDSILGFAPPEAPTPASASEEDTLEAQLSHARALASRKRRDAGLLQAADDLARAQSAGAYQGSDIQGPMLKQAGEMEAAPLLKRRELAAARLGRIGEEAGGLDLAAKKRAAALETAEDDPNSPESVTARSLVPEEIRKQVGAGFERMSAAQIKRASPQIKDNLDRELARRKAIADAESVRSRAEMMATDPTLSALEEGLKQPGLADSFRRKLSGARTKEDLEAIERQIDNARGVLGIERSDRRLAEALGVRKDAAADADEERKKLERDKRASRFDRLSKDLEDIRPALDSIATIEGIIKANPGDVPGVGWFDSKLPAMGPDAQRLRQTLQGIKNVYFKTNAGGNVTGGEQERIERMLDGAGSEAEMKEGLRLLKKAFMLRYEARTKPIAKDDPTLAGELEEAILPPGIKPEATKPPVLKRPMTPGQKIKMGGQTYVVGKDGRTLERSD